MSNPADLENACNSILIVEDEPEIRESLKEALEWEGYTVGTACNGKEALEKLSIMPKPCLILLDLMMPVMNGFEFAAALKHDVVLTAIPIVVLSAFSGQGEDKIGAKVALKKPVDLDVLFSMVKKYSRDLGSTKKLSDDTEVINQL